MKTSEMTDGQLKREYMDLWVRIYGEDGSYAQRELRTFDDIAVELRKRDYRIIMKPTIKKG